MPAHLDTHTKLILEELASQLLIWNPFPLMYRELSVPQLFW